jgi:hypothetical protein
MHLGATRRSSGSRLWTGSCYACARVGSLRELRQILKLSFFLGQNGPEKGSLRTATSANESLRTDTRYWPLTVSEQDIIEHRADLFDAVSYLMLSSSQIVMTGQS